MLSPDLETDAELVARSRRRDAGAFGSLIARHQDLVFGVALARCGDPALAEDIAQDAFITAWRDLDRLRDHEKVGAWVAGIARNLAASASRDRARRAAAVVPAPPAAPSPEAAAVEREDRELLLGALPDVPAPQREALILYYLEGQSIARIAGALGVRDDVVKQRLSRGRRALRASVAARVESALARVRPGPGFGAGVIAAVVATGTDAAAAATGAAGKVALLVTTKQKLAIGIAALVITGGATWVGVRAVDGDHAAPLPPAPTAPTVAAPGSAAPSPAARPRVRRMADPAQRQALLVEIRDAQRRRAATRAGAPAGGAGGAATGGLTPPAPDDDAPDPDKEYIRGAVQGLVPLLVECYEQGLATDPDLAGTVLVEFTIEGEPAVGGLVGDSAIDPTGTTLSDPAVRECIQETMHALEIDPPTGGGKVVVRYPFTFSPRSED